MQKYSSMITGVTYSKTFFHPENGEGYQFQVSTLVAATLSNDNISTSVAIYVFRGAQMARVGLYRTDEMNAYSALTIAEMRVEASKKWIEGWIDSEAIRLAQYALRVQAGPEIKINKRGEMDGPALWERIIEGMRNEIN